MSPGIIRFRQLYYTAGRRFRGHWEFSVKKINIKMFIIILKNYYFEDIEEGSDNIMSF